MIHGTGIDLVEHDRFSAILQRHGKRFLEKVFTARELAEGEAEHRPPHGWAARFAAKEAVFKSFGFPTFMVWHDIELLREGKPFPRVILHGPYELMVRRHGNSRFHLSITHSRTVSAAVAVWEGIPEAPAAPPPAAGR